ncbi:FAD-dependent oxidoreductase [Streptomyces sp. NBC_01298]|uniref:NAD(P)/FAD-dependent oxidoreductase n=1 Tax=Streptomyces sp. NBC_01298 TaxID=2903817 RepID=UPI002E163814|nr:FAD-dependent oxidoreductase [Streptomyces sp. NBC_01298]
MKHRIVVLGAGYAGAYVAGNLARRLSPADTEITVVNAEPDFVERLRLHQLAAGQEIGTRKLADVFAGTGIRLSLARVTAVDPERRTVTVTAAGASASAGADAGADHGTGELGYDTLLYALGSHGDDRGVPGVAEHAFDVAARPSALRLRERLDSLGGAGEVLVVGDGLTGIETATELAESRPGLSVTLVAPGELGARLSTGARGHLRRACDRLGITVVEHTRVEAVEATRVLCADGTALPSDATVWTAGFAVAPIAAAAGLAVTADGRILVDATMRSVSHPEVYAAGDSVHTIGANGLPLPMSCASAGFTGMQAMKAIMGSLTGTGTGRVKLAYQGNHISLGRQDAILQLVDGAARAKPAYTGGRKAARIKAAILKMSLWTTSHPTFGLPKRRRRLTAVPDRSVAAA